MVKTLTLEQEAKAFQRMEKGGIDGERVREAFIAINQPLVGSIVAKYLNRIRPLCWDDEDAKHIARPVSWGELMSAGNVGLLKAVQKFDYKRGFKFSTYAVPWITGEIKRVQREFAINARKDKGEFTTQELEALDERLKAQAAEVEALERAEEIGDGLQEQCEAINTEIDAVDGEKLTPASAKEHGIGTHAGNALESAVWSDDPLPTTIEDADQSAGMVGELDRYHLPALNDALHKLEDVRLRQIVEMRFGMGGQQPHTLEQIGKALGITLQRVHILQNKAIEQLKELMGELIQ